MNKYLDTMISGTKFASLTFIDLITNKNRIYGRFLCDCGRIKNIFCHNVANGTVLSCGCLSSWYKSKAINSSLGSEVGLFFMLTKAQYRSKTKNIHIELNINDLLDIWRKQSGKCFYSGIALTLKTFSTECNLTNQASLDRINSNLGYTKDNIQFVSKEINFMKMELIEDEFLEVCSLISETFS